MSVEALIERLLDDWPPLTSQQVDAIARVARGGSHSELAER